MLKKVTSFSKNSPLKFSFTSKQMTAYGGMIILARIFDKIKVREFINEAWPIKETSNNSRGIYPKFLGYWLGIIAGGKRFSHILFLGHSIEVLSKMFSVEGIPIAATTFSRFFGKFQKQIKVDEFKKSLWNYIYQWIPWGDIKEDWLDCDSTVIEKYGRQEGTSIGYNTKKKGRPSYHPLLIFLGSNDYLINLWNRPGNAHTSNNIIGFLEESLTMLADKIKILGIRLDSGFYQKNILEFIESKKLNFVISAKFFKPLKIKIHSTTEWTKVDKGLWVSSFMYKPYSWEKEYLHVAIKQEIAVREKATGKQLRLFNEVDEKYRYSAVVTNIEKKTAKEIWDLYKPRANCENRIDEMKTDFALGGFSMKSFWATELAMLCRALLFNIFVYFRNTIAKEKRTELKTIRPKYFIVPGILGKNARETILRLSLPDLSIRAKLKQLISHISQWNPAIEIKCNAFGTS